jgi:hypothetical protein
MYQFLLLRFVLYVVHALPIIGTLGDINPELEFDNSGFQDPHVDDGRYGLSL